VRPAIARAGIQAMALAESQVLWLFVNHLNDSGRSWGSPGGAELEVFRPLLNDTCQ